MNLPSWSDLITYYCDGSSHHHPNPYREKFANRRYNYAVSNDKDQCRLIFLKSVLEGNHRKNATLVRDGRFIWCKDLVYEGKNTQGYREISFSVDKGSKRFQVSEDKMMCLPSKTWVTNSSYLSRRNSTFTSFSTVFSYKNALKMMAKNSELSYESFVEKVQQDSPYKVGSLVVPKVGYFYPYLGIGKDRDYKIKDTTEHPVGVIISRTAPSDYVAKEFYQVRFAETTYEKVHPVQLEVINEI